MGSTLQDTVVHERSPDVVASLRNVCISLLIINTVFMILRFTSVLFARTKKLKLAWDDWLLVPAYILLVSMMIGGLVEYHYLSRYDGLPDDMISDPEIFVPVMKTVFALTQLVTPTFALTRFSILALFIRIFYRPYVRITSYFLIAFVVCQVIAFNIASATQCLPTEFFWKRIFYLSSTGGRHCVDIDALYRSFQGPEMFVDLIVIFLPLPEIWRLRSSNTRKLGLSALFSTGIIALFANCYRQYIFIKNPITWPSPRVNTETISWAIIEPSVCFIAACLPAMHPLASKLLPSSWRRSINYRSSRLVKRVTPEPRMTMDEDTTRLMSMDRAVTPISPSEPPRAYGCEAKAIRTVSTEELEAAVFPCVPLNDWKQVSRGDGVLMRMEVSVTQEDIIEDVLGF